MALNTALILIILVILVAKVPNPQTLIKTIIQRLRPRA